MILRLSPTYFTAQDVFELEFGSIEAEELANDPSEVLVSNYSNCLREIYCTQNKLLTRTVFI